MNVAFLHFYFCAQSSIFYEAFYFIYYKIKLIKEKLMPFQVVETFSYPRIFNRFSHSICRVLG